MVAGVFVYPHLFSTQKTNVSDLLTSDSPTRFLNRLVSVLVAVATLPLWEELFRHTDPTPSSEKIKWVAAAPPAVWSRCISSAVSVRCLTIPVPVKYLEMTPDISMGDGGVVIANSNSKNKNCRGLKRNNQWKPFRFKSAPPDCFYMNNPNIQ